MLYQHEFRESCMQGSDRHFGMQSNMGVAPGVTGENQGDRWSSHARVLAWTSTMYKNMQHLTFHPGHQNVFSPLLRWISFVPRFLAKKVKEYKCCLFPCEPGGISAHHVKVEGYKEFVVCIGSNLARMNFRMQQAISTEGHTPSLVGQQLYL